jgi:hypothetical protein
MHISRRLRHMLRRYLPAEIIGTVAAVGGAWLAYRLSGSPYAAAWSGSVCETVGYYGAILVEEARRSRDPSTVRAVLVAVPGVIVEFGPAEVLDTLLVRPLLMAAGPVMTGSLVGGTLAGKLAADIAFYAVVLPSSRLRRRLLPGHGAGHRPAAHRPGRPTACRRPARGRAIQRLRHPRGRACRRMMDRCWDACTTSSSTAPNPRRSHRSTPN